MKNCRVVMIGSRFRKAYFEGYCKQVVDETEIRYVFELSKKLDPRIAGEVNYENYKNRALKFNIYKLKPKTIQFYSEQVYGKDKFEKFSFS